MFFKLQGTNSKLQTISVIARALLEAIQLFRSLFLDCFVAHASAPRNDETTSRYSGGIYCNKHKLSHSRITSLLIQQMFFQKVGNHRKQMLT